MEGRRLPSWMLDPPSNGETCNSKSSLSASFGRRKDNAVTTQDKESEAKELTANLLPGNEREKKRGKRKLLEHHGEGCSDAIIIVTTERKKVGDADPIDTRRTRRTTRTRRRKERYLPPSHDDDDKGKEEYKIVYNSDVGNEDDDVELTEEDLLSIANEYIAAAANEDSKIIYEETKKVGGCSNGSLPTKEAAAAAETPFASERSSDEKKSPVIPSTIACQDMLNLLLGNVLTRNVGQDEILVSNDMQEQLKESQSTITDSVTDATVPMIEITKKKSSLKDKITTLLS